MSNINGQLVHKSQWDGHLVEIEDSGDYRSLYFGSRSLQSRMSMSSPHELVLSYTAYMAFTILIHPNPTDILVIGIGAGSFVRFFHHHFPRCRLDAVDYSPHIINAAKGYFQLPENKRVSAHCADGCHFLQEQGHKQYDLILIDAFNDQGMAPTVYSELFFQLCRRSLTQEGLVSCNLWSDDAVRLQELKNIFSDHFTSCLYLPVPGKGNIIALPMPFEVPWKRIRLKKRELNTLSKRYGLNFKEMVKVAKQNNLTLSERLSAMLL